MSMLDADRIAELVEAAKGGQLPETPAPASRRQGRLRTVDFSRPTKFSADVQRRINRSSEIFCTTAATRLSSQLRWPVELEILNTVQLTWAATQAQVPNGSLLAVLEVAPLGTRMLLTIEQSFVLVCLECLLGGAPQRPARDRKLSEIDWALAKGLLESLVQPLALVWNELGGVDLTLGEVGPHETSQVASVSEPTFSTVIEARINQQSYSLGLLIPWASISSIEDALAGTEQTDAGLDPHAAPTAAPMSAVPVTVRVEVASTQLRVADILALSPGSTITFDAVADDGVSVFAADTLVGRARPGRQGSRRAVQLLDHCEEGR
jgi:flagellar motor switch protein FliM